MKKHTVLFGVLLLVTSIFILTFVIADDKGKDSDGGSNSGGSSGFGSDGGSSSGSGSKGGSDNSKGGDSKESNENKGEPKDSENKGLEKSTGAGKKKEEKKEETNKEDKNGKEETKTIIGEGGVEIKTKTEAKEGKTETEEIRTYIDEKGNMVEIKTEIETKEGESETVVETKTISPDGTVTTIKWETETTEEKTETKVEKKIISPDGTEIKIETKTEIEDGKEEVKNSIEVKGATVTTKLELKVETEEGQMELKAKLSTGTEQAIIVLPDEALQTAFNELQATNNFTFELKEVQKGNERKAVFSATATQPGKLLGIFDTQVNLETLIDTVTGEIIKTERPWWAFLVVAHNEAPICHLNSPNSAMTKTVLIIDVKSHLSHGDSVGECVAACGDGVIIQGVESCELGDLKVCITPRGYTGSATCTVTCTGFDPCVSTNSCGDGIVNGLEKCDDGNALNGDGCSTLCQVEVLAENNALA